MDVEDQTMIQIDNSSPIMVTGATGYVAGWIVKALVEAGCTVHAPVRNPDNTAKLKHLIDIAEKSPGEIIFSQADLLKEGSYDKPMQGCSIVFHTASPFTVDVKDAQKQLIEPAVNGTKIVLETANRTQSVQRVVLTSSCAAIYGDNVDVNSTPNKRLDESIWNSSSSLTHNPYSYSKTLAEKAAWEIAEKQDRWKLVAINPGLVLGPALQDKPTSESFNLVKQMGDGTLKSGAPRWGFAIVDVRDLADAHIAAAFSPAAHGRNIIVGHESNLFEASQLLKDKYGQYPLPSRAAPKWLVWLVAPYIGGGMTRKIVSRNLDLPCLVDNSKAKRELGINYRPLQESMEDMFQQMIDVGILPQA